jgi:hypothetical protein
MLEGVPRSTANRHFLFAAAISLVSLAFCAGCVAPIIGEKARSRDGVCEVTPHGKLCDCEKCAVNREPSRWQWMHSSYHAAYEKCAGWMPHSSHSDKIEEWEAPRPGRFHAVPTRPVFGGGYEVF